MVPCPASAGLQSGGRGDGLTPPTPFLKGEKMTQPIPTDKHGNIYYGSRTFKEAETSICDDGVDPAQLADQMETAGFPGVARRIRREFEVDEQR